MAKNSFIEHLNTGDYEKAYKELSNAEKITNVENQLNLALLKRYQGNINQGIDILESLYKQKDKLDDKINIRTSLLIIYYYYATNKPSILINDVKSFLYYLESQIDLSSLGPFWLAIDKYSKAKMAEHQNDFPKAINYYQEAIPNLENQDNKLELMHAYYLLGSTYRVYGDYSKAQESLEKALKVVPKADEFRKAQFLNYSSEILFLRSKSNYRKALDNLQKSLSIWKSLNMQFGIAWAIHDLGLVYYLSGDLTKAYEFLRTAYSFITDQTDVQYKVRNLLSLIELLTELDNQKESNDYFEELKDLIEFDFMFEDELELAEAFILRQSQRLSDQMFALKIFEKLNQKNKLSYELKIKALLNHLDLALIELKYAQSDEAVTATKGIVKQLLDYTEKSYDLLVQTTILIDKFNDLLEEKDQEIPFNAISVRELNPLLHSVPRLSIILYIISRKGVTFSELEKNTGLTQGNISTHTAKLIEEGLILSEKMFMDTKQVTVYTMTDEGVREFERYVRILTDILQGFLSN